MDIANLDFWERESLVIASAPHLFFGGITALIVPLGLLIWFLVSWAYRHRFAAKDDQLAARDERLALAQDSAQAAERKSKDLQLEIEKLEAQLQARASFEDITLTASSAKTKVDELVIANNAISAAIGVASGVSTAAGVSGSLSNTPIALRVQAETDKERQKRAH